LANGRHVAGVGGFVVFGQFIGLNIGLKS